jgi:uncharacterized protein YdeI (YjbR/CyaY-like superfamily)
VAAVAGGEPRRLDRRLADHLQEGQRENRPLLEDAVEEALCFGWIDGKANTLDGERYQQRFTPRRRGSTWAQSNKQRVEKLMAQGLMQPAGLALVAAAKADGSWQALDAVDALRIPPELETALEAVPGAAANFASLSASTRKMILFWLTSAKRPETRQKRLEQIVAAAAQNRSPLDLPPS